MKTVFNGIMKNKWTKLAALVIAALWSGPTVQAQAPHPERIYLSGTGIDNTKTWEFFCSGGQNSGKWRDQMQEINRRPEWCRRIYDAEADDRIAA